VSRALGLLAGWLLDRALGDPRRWHPVAGFGSAAAAVEKVVYRDARVAGVVHVLALVAPLAAVGTVAEGRLQRHPVLHTAATAAVTWAALGGRSLDREAGTISAQLGAGDLGAARRQVRNLVGRDPSRLDADGVARACIESLAENTSDAVTAPLLWGGALGLPGLLAYRAVNTLDAMVGHRSPRYLRFGWAAARLDDVVNWVPARVAGAAAVAFGTGLGSGSRGEAMDVVRRDAPAHPSPNGGVVEGAFAGILGVSIGGTNVYDGRVEDRGVLGRGPAATARDIDPARRLATRVGLASLAVAALVASLVERRGPRT
jgi:adenosylcobinamide-phosphate synthase